MCSYLAKLKAAAALHATQNAARTASPSLATSSSTPTGSKKRKYVGSASSVCDVVDVLAVDRDADRSSGNGSTIEEDISDPFEVRCCIRSCDLKKKYN